MKTTSRSRGFWTALAVFALPLVAACASTGGAGQAEAKAATPRIPSQGIPVVVENDNFNDVTVYAMTGSASYRLGTVTGIHSDTLHIRQAYLAGGPLRLLVDPIGSLNAYLSDPVIVDQRSEVQLDVGQTLALSTISTWDRKAQ